MTFLGTLAQRAVHRPPSPRCSASSRLSQLARGRTAAMGNVMSGIAEALIATGVGLVVAIPAVVAFNVRQKRIGRDRGQRVSIGKQLLALLKVRRAQGEEGRQPRAEASPRSTLATRRGLDPRPRPCPRRRPDVAAPAVRRPGRAPIVGSTSPPWSTSSCAPGHHDGLGDLQRLAEPQGPSCLKGGQLRRVGRLRGPVTWPRAARSYFNQEPVDEKGLIAKLKQVAAQEPGDQPHRSAAIGAPPTGEVVHVIDLGKIEGSPTSPSTSRPRTRPCAGRAGLVLSIAATRARRSASP